MSDYSFKNKQMYIEETPTSQIINTINTPAYVYSKQAIIKNWQNFSSALQHRRHKICYAVKANSNLQILNLLAQLGCGFDVVSIGELKRALSAGGLPENIVYSGVGKTITELSAAIQENIFCINVESIAELKNIISLAEQQQKRVTIAFRINPNVTSSSHPYISCGAHKNKFGLNFDDLTYAFNLASNHDLINVIGFSVHVGSLLVTPTPVIEALSHINSWLQTIKNHPNFTLRYFNIGGGYNVPYSKEDLTTYIPIPEIFNLIEPYLPSGDYELVLEPGRAMVANSGILLTQVTYIKHNFCIVDCGMNDFIRPALYNAYHEIINTVQHDHQNVEINTYDIVGPLCESGDFLGNMRTLSIKQGDVLAILDVGAYGFSMGSNYNSRCRPPEVLIDKNQIYIIHQRETLKELLTNEQSLLQQNSIIIGDYHGRND